MNRWLISDIHRGHSMLAALEQAHERRPADVDDIVARNWRKLVKPDDLVIDLGDTAFTAGAAKFNLKEHLATLPGRKVLILGNHDAHTVSWFMANGFDFACDGLLLGGVWFTHKPQYKLPYGARLNVHGHLHCRYPRGVRVRPFCRLFSLEYEHYMPRKLDSWLKSIEREKPFVPEKDYFKHSTDMQPVQACSRCGGDGQELVADQTGAHDAYVPKCKACGGTGRK